MNGVSIIYQFYRKKWRCGYAGSYGSYSTCAVSRGGAHGILHHVIAMAVESAKCDMTNGIAVGNDVQPVVTHTRDIVIVSLNTLIQTTHSTARHTIFPNCTRNTSLYKQAKTAPIVAMIFHKINRTIQYVLLWDGRPGQLMQRESMASV